MCRFEWVGLDEKMLAGQVEEVSVKSQSTTIACELLHRTSNELRLKIHKFIY